MLTKFTFTAPLALGKVSAAEETHKHAKFKI